jgi:hypothetical protein
MKDRRDDAAVAVSAWDAAFFAIGDSETGAVFNRKLRFQPNAGRLRTDGRRRGESRSGDR